MRREGPDLQPPSRQDEGGAGGSYDADAGTRAATQSLGPETRQEREKNRIF